MKKKTCAVLVSLFLAAPSFAQVKKPEAKPVAPAGPKTEVTFDPHDILGEKDSPDGTIIQAAPEPKFDSLIRVRDNFTDKMQESVYDL